MKFEYGSINFEELKSFERRRENTRVYFSDKPALPIVIKFKQVCLFVEPAVVRNKYFLL